MTLNNIRYHLLKMHIMYSEYSVTVKKLRVYIVKISLLGYISKLFKVPSTLSEFLVTAHCEKTLHNIIFRDNRYSKDCPYLTD